MRTLCTLLLLSVYTVASAQLEVVDTANEPKYETVGKIGPMGDLWVEIKKSDDNIKITYMDMKYQNIESYKEIKFMDVDGAYDKLYEIMLDGFYDMPNESKVIKLGDSIVLIEYTKVMGVVSVRFIHSVTDDGSVLGFSTWLTKRKLARLFGKKYKKRK